VSSDREVAGQDCDWRVLSLPAALVFNTYLLLLD
jgi:hypothetical protein